MEHWFPLQGQGRPQPSLYTNVDVQNNTVCVILSHQDFGKLLLWPQETKRDGKGEGPF